LLSPDIHGSGFGEEGDLLAQLNCLTGIRRRFTLADKFGGLLGLRRLTAINR